MIFPKKTTMLFLASCSLVARRCSHAFVPRLLLPSTSSSSSSSSLSRRVLSSSTSTSFSRGPRSFLVSSNAINGDSADGMDEAPATKGDEYDDWYADFDPSVYDTYSGMATSDSDNNSDSFGGGGGGGRSYGGGRGRGGGGRGGGYGGGGRQQNQRSVQHDYERDTSRDASNIDEAAVNDLLNERLAAKFRRDFDTADAIRDQLLEEYSVGVFDKDRMWRTGCSPSGSGMRGGGRGGDRGGRGGDRGGRGRGGPQSRRPAQDFGPNGHDYEVSPDAGPNQSDLEDAEIHEMLADRLQAKLARKFHIADEIQSQLLAAGVYVHDGGKEWRADGVPFGDLSKSGGKPGRTAGSRSDRNSYSLSQYSKDLPEGMTPTLMDKILQERMKFKDMRDYEKADGIIDGLRTKYDIFVDDRLREWSVGGDFGEIHNTQRQMANSLKERGYVKDPESPLAVSDEDEAYIAEKIDERLQAKRDRDFDLADSIRDALTQEFQVYIDDRNKMWSIGGGGPKAARGARGYTRRGGGDVSDEDLAIIADMLEERVQAKKNRDFDVADDLRDELKSRFNVICDDKSREWHIDSDEYVLVGEHNLSDEQVQMIDALLKERLGCKALKEYERADEIRDQLDEEFNVVVDDRTKEWKCLDVQADPIFQQDSIESQASAFKRTQIDRDLDDELDSLFEGLEDDAEPAMSNGATEEESADDEEEENVAFATDDSVEDLESLTVPQLKEKLREAGLPVSGRKSELIERLSG